MYVYINRIWRWMTYKGWYAIKPKQPTNNPFCFLERIILVFLCVLTSPMLLLLSAEDNLSNQVLLYILQGRELSQPSQSSIRTSPHFSFFVTKSLPTSALECSILRIVIDFLILWSMYLISSLVLLKKGPT